MADLIHGGKPIVAVDWGTSSLRGALLSAQGKVLDERAFARGILSVAPNEFPAVFDNCFGDWMQTPGLLCLISGMAGSRQGWLETPYCPCPADFAAVARHVAWIVPGRIAIVPGLSIEKAGIPDVMRGEETQVFGALQTLGLRNAQLVLPGTHSKWVQVESGCITGFTTFMTGEVFALLRQHSILAKSLAASDATFNSTAFVQGLAYARKGKGLLQTAFSVRTLSLFDRLGANALTSYLSGLLIGEEIHSQSLLPGETLLVLGADALSARYAQALEFAGAKVQIVPASVTWTGLWCIGQTLLH